MLVSFEKGANLLLFGPPGGGKPATEGQQAPRRSKKEKSDA